MPRTSPGVRLLPNAITVLALCAGLSAVQFALTEQHHLAIGAIGIAAILDGLDGRIARLLDATSKIGAELDSLADAISFGVAPALVLYIWFPHTSKLGWGVALLFAVCMVLRLARFNTLQDSGHEPTQSDEFFVGIPAPAGGLLALLPVMITLQFGPGWWSTQITAWVWTLLIATLLISRIPTLSVKKFRAPAKAAAPLLVGVGLLAAVTIQYPLIALSGSLLLYLLHIPYAARRARQSAKRPEAGERRSVRQGRKARRLGLRRPQFGRAAGAARRVVTRPRPTGHGPRVYPPDVASPAAPRPRGRTTRRRGRQRKVGLRHREG